MAVVVVEWGGFGGGGGEQPASCVVHGTNTWAGVQSIQVNTSSLNTYIIDFNSTNCKALLIVSYRPTE